MKKIKLTQGHHAIVDDGDYEWLSRWKWHAAQRGKLWYAKGYIRPPSGGPLKPVLMHRLITEAPPGVVVHHINKDSLDNRRCNLQILTPPDHEYTIDHDEEL